MLLNETYPVLSGYSLKSNDPSKGYIHKLLTADFINLGQFLDAQILIPASLKSEKLYTESTEKEKIYKDILLTANPNTESITNSRLVRLSSTKNNKDKNVQNEIIVKMLAIKGILSPGNPFLEKISMLNKENSIFQSEALQYLLEYKWTICAKYYYIRKLVIYVIFCTVFSINSLYLVPHRIKYKEGNKEEDHIEAYRIASLCLNAGTLILLLYFLKNELCQVYELGRNYFHSTKLMVNVFDLSFILFGLGAILCNTLCAIDSDDGDLCGITTLKIFNALGNFFVWIKLFTFVTGFRNTAFMVNMIIKCFWDIRYFLFVLIILIVTFAFTIYLVQENLSDNGLLQFIKIYHKLTLGDFVDFDKYIHNEESAGIPTWIIWAFFFLSTLTLLIVMLNLLIAIIGNTFSKVSKEEKYSYVYERIQIITEVDSDLSKKMWNEQCKKLENAYLYFSQIKNEDKSKQELSNEDLSEQINRIENQMKNLNLKVEKIPKKLNKISFLEEAIKKNSDLTEKKYQELITLMKKYK